MFVGDTFGPYHLHLFTHSFRLFSPSSSPLLFRGAPRHSTDAVSEFQAEAPQATAIEGVIQGPYVAARAGFEPATLRTKGDESTNESPRPTLSVTVHTVIL